MNQLLKDIVRLLHHGESVALATITTHGGSAPRGAGAKMAIRSDGRILGTVGGGLLEAKAIQHAGRLLHQPAGSAEFMQFDLTNELAAGSDMICGGRVRLLLEHVAPGTDAARALEEASELLRMGYATALCRAAQGHPAITREHAAVLLDGGSTLLPGDMLRAVAQARKTETPALIETGDRLVLVEALLPAPSLFILGAGHVSQPTAAMASMAGFRTVVMDDRANFANRDRFPGADEIVALRDFDDVFADHMPDTRAHVVIVTRGHLHDRTVLAQALRTPARYVGMIGSRRKRDSIYESLLSDGFTQADIDRCHCPIGLSIGAQTPEEIAVSIVAELVGCRAGVMA